MVDSDPAKIEAKNWVWITSYVQFMAQYAHHEAQQVNTNARRPMPSHA